jgi:hypothetical protein
MKRAFNVIALALSLLTPSLIEVNQAHAAVSSGVGVVTNNLLMYFDLANPSGISGTSLNDLAGNFSAGTLIQTASQPSLNTGNGSYLNFTGNSGYVDLPDISSASNWTGLSVSFYANMGTRSAVERIFDFGNGQQNNNIWVGMGDGNDMVIEVWHDNAAPGWCRSANGSVVANEWAQWTVVLDGSTCKWYKNNTLSQSTNYTYLPWARTLTLNYLGKSNWSTDPYFEGYLGDLAIYKSALTDAERLQNYNAQTDIVAPVVTTSSIQSYETSTAIGTLSFTGSPTTFWLTGPDSGYFTLSNSGVLAFSSLQNYEVRTAAGGSSNYDITVWAMDANGNTDHWTIVVQLQNAIEASTLSQPTLSATPYKGIAVTITVTPAGDGTSIPGKITYLMAGKRIVGCYKKSYSGTGNSTCSWKPTTMGYREITVAFTPTNSFFTAASTKKTFWIYRRTTLR